MLLICFLSVLDHVRYYCMNRRVRLAHLLGTSLCVYATYPYVSVVNFIWCFLVQEAILFSFEVKHMNRAFTLFILDSLFSIMSNIHFKSKRHHFLDMQPAVLFIIIIIIIK